MEDHFEVTRRLRMKRRLPLSEDGVTVYGLMMYSKGCNGGIKFFTSLKTFMGLKPYKGSRSIKAKNCLQRLQLISS